MKTCDVIMCATDSAWKARVHLHDWVNLCTGCLMRAVQAQTDETRQTPRKEFPIVAIEPLQPV